MSLNRPATAALLFAMVTLAGCESVDEKAERLFQESTELVADGDPERALVTLRSVFRLDGEHRDARLLYASLAEDLGNAEEAYGHYRLAAEQYPQDLEPRLALVRLGVSFGAWQEVSRHLDAAERIDADDGLIKVVRNMLDYRDAVDQNDAALVQNAVSAARDNLAADPSDIYSRQVLVDNLIKSQQYTAALDEIDKGLALDPRNPNLNQLKLALLGELNDMDRLGSHLQTMVELFPENRELHSALVRWFMSTDNVDGAEQFIRDLAAAADGAVAPYVTLIQFLREIRGVEVALAEIDELIGQDIDDTTFTLMKASLIFDDGRRDEGIAILDQLIEGREASDTTRDLQTTKARMLIGVDRGEQAREIIEDVLAEDDKNVEALKLKSDWLIDEDRTRDAILALRTALDQSPQDAEAITLLARAYERDGNRELMAESLALAVDASRAAPAETLRYTRYLINTEKYLSAEDTLLRGLRTSPTDSQLLNALGQVYVALDDWARAEQVVNALNRIGTPETRTLATALQATILQQLERTDESITLLRGMMDDDQNALAAQAAIIRTHLSNGELRPARAFMDELLAEIGNAPPAPETDGLRFLNAALTAVEGNMEQAEALYRDLVERNPGQEVIWRAYAAILLRQDRTDEAEAVIDEALQHLPENANILWIKAGLRERDNDPEAAIGIYERLYEQNSDSTVVANNLASLITTYREDEASLERAYTIARRLRGIELPAMQDTYGWIAYRIGNYQEAVENLEPAAAGLPGDPSVQYHYAKALVAVGRNDEAVPYFRAAVDGWQENGNPRLADAESELARLTSSAPLTEAN